MQDISSFCNVGTTTKSTVALQSATTAHHWKLTPPLPKTQGATDMESSVGWTVDDDGGWAGVGGGVGVGGSRSVVSFDNNSGDGSRRSGDGGDEATVQAPASIVRSLRSVSTSASESKSIFELSQRYIGLALCSSGRTVVPVRLGRAIAEATAPPKASSLANRRLGRPAPPPRAAAGNTENAGVARRISPRISAGVATFQQLGRRRSVAQTPTACGTGGGGGGATDANAEWEGSSSKLPIENDRQTNLGKEPAASPMPHHYSPSPSRAGVDVTGTAAETTTTTTTANNDQDAGSVGASCSRGRHCGASPTRERSASSERLGGGAEFGVLLARYHRIETYDCPVSPFSMPPSWADIPPLATMEPPGFPPPCETRRETTTVVEGAGVERAKGDHLEGGDSSTSLQVEDETKKTSVARPVEQTVFQKIASGRRVSFGWGWNRPPGDRGRRRKRNGLSPKERQLWSGIDVGRVCLPNS